MSDALEWLAEGQLDAVARACASCEHLIPRVQAAVDAAVRLPEIIRFAPSGDGRTGEVLRGRYRLSGRLGAGAMGVVYEAVDEDLQRRVAIKILSAGLVHPKRAEIRFDREARAMASIEHTSVVAIHDRGRTENGEDFIVMDLVDGGSLATFVEGLSYRGVAAVDVDVSETYRTAGSDSAADTTYIRWVAQSIADLADGVQAAHAVGIIHRDIKPSNVLLRADGRCILVDFGIAHVHDGADITRGGSSIGTPAFMAPECALSGRNASTASDVYGLAAVLYYLITLKQPYEGTPVGVLAQLGSRDPVPPGRLHAGLAKDLGAIIEKGMSRAPGARYRSAAALAEDLRSFLAHRPVVARPVRPIARAWRRLRRSTASLAVVGVLLVLAIVAGGRAQYARHTERRDAQWLEVRKALPPNFTICDHAHRAVRSQADRGDLLALLNRGVRVARDPLYSRLLRASFHLDHGDPEAAAADMRALADHEGTEFSQALARAYTDLAGDAVGSRSVDRSRLPVPETLRDRFLAGYHCARDYEDQQAIDWLTDDVLQSVTGALPVRLALEPYEGMSIRTRRARALEVWSEIERAEERMGTATAWSRHASSAVLGYLGRFDEAYEASLESIALAPRTHVNHTNAGYAAYVLDDLEEARRHFRVALELQPTDRRSAENLYWTYIRANDHDAAIDVATQHGRAVDQLQSGWSANACAVIEVYRALGIHLSISSDTREADLARRDQALAKAAGYFEAAKAVGAREVWPTVHLMIKAMKSGDDSSLSEVIARAFADDPDAWWRLDLLRQCLPESMDPGGAVTLVLKGIVSQRVTLGRSQ